jgi:hypothetical protein
MKNIHRVSISIPGHLAVTARQQSRKKRRKFMEYRNMRADYLRSVGASSRRLPFTAEAKVD